jgi:hypothetical protein
MQEKSRLDSTFLPYRPQLATKEPLSVLPNRRNPTSDIARCDSSTLLKGVLKIAL